MKLNLNFDEILARREVDASQPTGDTTTSIVNAPDNGKAHSEHNDTASLGPSGAIVKESADNATVYSVKLNCEADLEEFARAIRDTVVSTIALSEKFSAIRLRNAELRYNDFMHPSYLGLTTNRGADTTIDIRSYDNSAVQLAGVMVHELAHVLVGAAASHGDHWHDACGALGLIVSEDKGQRFVREHFTPALWHAIVNTIERLAKEKPELVYDPNVEIPRACDDDYLDFQKDGIRWMLANPRNILLADEMGLGKTIQVVGYINVAKPKKVLVLCPNSLKLNWKRELEKWGTVTYDVEVAGSTLFMMSDFTIMNYEALKNWEFVLPQIEWDLLVCDEAHYLKNPSAARSKAVYNSIKAKKKIFTSGTPIVNYPYEVFPLIHNLDRETWPSYRGFEYRYCSKSGNKFGRNLGELQSRLRNTIMLRRLKKDVMSSLPRKRRQVIEFEVDDATAKLIEEEKRIWSGGQKNGDLPIEVLQFLSSDVKSNESGVTETEIDWAAIIEALKYNRKYLFEEMARIRHKIALAKLPYVLDHIDNILEAKDKLVVFAHHLDVLDAIAEKFNNGRSVLMTGESTLEERQTAVDRFQNDEKCNLFVGGLKVAGLGITLTAASHCIFAEMDWVPGTLTQAEDRLHRIGQEANSILIQHLVFENSLDTAMAKKIIQKQKSIDRALNK